MPRESSNSPSTGNPNSGETDTKKLKPCCACPQTKQARDQCIIENGEKLSRPKNLKQFISENFTACANRFPFLQEAQIRGKLQEDWKRLYGPKKKTIIKKVVKPIPNDEIKKLETTIELLSHDNQSIGFIESSGNDTYLKMHNGKTYPWSHSTPVRVTRNNTHLEEITRLPFSPI
ncbi:uncharacterized protein LOC128386789 [Panonychus citri]|uniref:uncharacterized protein LOC128386789 n=1 Tax=Panonychus citri TaxID=50023 RepID=UPI002307A14C|nr:uncharacterized protein LOC128386789 [Panonychus citri]